MARIEHGPDPSAVDLELLDLALDRFSSRTARRGSEYAVQGRVRGLVVRHDVIEAIVRGTATYAVRWTCEDDEWWPACTCPIGLDCKHAYAVAICALQASVGIELRPAPRSKPPSRPRHSPFDVLRNSPSTVERGEALRHLCADRSRPSLPWLVTPHDVLAEEDPDIRCWRAALAVRRQSNGWLPEVLEPFRERPDLAAKVMERERSALVQALSAWARAQHGGDRQLVVEVGLAVGHDGTVHPVAKPLLTTSRLTEAPRTVSQLRQLRSEVSQRPSLLAPAAAGLLVWLTDNDIGADTNLGMTTHAFGPGTFFDRVGQADAGRWNRDIPCDLAQRAGIDAGGVVRWARDPVQLLPALLSRDGATRIELWFHWPDGRTRRSPMSYTWLTHTPGRGHEPAPLSWTGSSFPSSPSRQRRSSTGCSSPAVSTSPLSNVPPCSGFSGLRSRTCAKPSSHTPASTR